MRFRTFTRGESATSFASHPHSEEKGTQKKGRGGGATTESSRPRKQQARGLAAEPLQGDKLKTKRSASEDTLQNCESGERHSEYFGAMELTMKYEHGCEMT